MICLANPWSSQLWNRNKCDEWNWWIVNVTLDRITWTSTAIKFTYRRNSRIRRHIFQNIVPKPAAKPMNERPLPFFCRLKPPIEVYYIWLVVCRRMLLDINLQIIKLWCFHISHSHVIRWCRRDCQFCSKMRVVVDCLAPDKCQICIAAVEFQCGILGIYEASSVDGIPILPEIFFYKFNSIKIKFYFLHEFHYTFSLWIDEDVNNSVLHSAV